MRGGGCHRITGITITHYSEKRERDVYRQLILREARGHSSCQLYREVAVLRYVGQHTSIPGPKIFKLDYSSENALEWPYVLISRNPGRDLDHFGDGKYPSNLTHEQQLSVAKGVAEIVLKLQQTSSPSPGEVKATEEDEGRRFTVCFPHDDTEMDLSDPNGATGSCSVRSVLDYLLSRFQEWEDPEDYFDIHYLHTESIKVRYRDRLIAVALEMNAAGYLDDNRFTLHHPDFLNSPANIMAKSSREKVMQITGILDWDEAVFQPSYFGCEMPNWIWDTKYQRGEYGNMVDSVPKTTKKKEIKQMFESTIGPEWLRLARDPGYGLARKLYSWAEHGIRWAPRRKGLDAEKEVEAFLTKWVEICPPKKPRVSKVHKKRTSPASNKSKRSSRNQQKGRVVKVSKDLPLPIKVNGEEEWEVEDIMDARRFAGGHVKCLIKWAGFDKPTCQPYKDVQHLDEMLSAFEARFPDKPIHRQRAKGFEALHRS